MVARGLGKGLEALFPQSEKGSAPPLGGRGGEQTGIPVSAVDPSPFQPRMEPDPGLIEELAASIRKHGILQPIIVRPVAGRFQLIAGQRRWLAAQKAGMERIPASVVEADDRQAATLALVENLQREDLNPLDLAEGIQRLSRTFHLNQQEVATLLGKSRSEVANTLRLLKAPAKVREAIRSGAISKGHARAILSASSPEEQLALLTAVEKESLSVRQVEHRVQRTKKALSSASRPYDHSAEVRDAARALEEALKTRVEVQVNGRGRGSIRIRFHSLDEFEGLFEKLTGRALRDDLDAG